MRTLSATILVGALLALPATAQKRAAPKTEPTFTEAVATAQKAFEAQDYGTAVSALQAAIKAVQKLQRVTIFAALPTPDGWEFEDEQPEDQAGNPFAASMAAMGMTVKRRYAKGDDHSIDVEVTASSPLVSMLSMMFANPALITADGGEVVEYGAHKAILKPDGDDAHELTILLYGKHLVKVNARGLSADALLGVFDQACIDRLDKALGK